MLKAVVRDKHALEVIPVPVDINSHYQAVLAPADSRSPQPIAAEKGAVSYRGGD